MASSKTRTNQPVDAADPVLGRYRQLAAVLADTAAAIPRLLSGQRELRAQVGRAEIEGGDAQRERLEAVNQQLASAARQRAAACDSVVALAGDLRAARAAAAQELAEIAQSVANDFALRWARATETLGNLIAESGVLAAALRTPIPCAAPYVPVLSPDGTKMLVSFAGHLRPDAVTLPPEVARITARLDQLDGALTTAAAVAQANELTERHRALCRVRRSPERMDGLYAVLKDFDYLGTRFTRGMLIDRTVLPDGPLYRFQVGKDLRAVEDAATVAA
jgi:hypothetical protein